MASTLHDPAPPAAAPAAATARTVVADRLRRLSPRGWAIWATVILTLALVPALVSAARPKTVRSDVVLEPVAGTRTGAGTMAAYARRFLAFPLVQSSIAARRSRYWSVIGLRHVDVDVAAAGPGGGGVRLSVPAGIPGDARDLAGIVAAQVTAHSRGAGSRRAGARANLRAIDRRLRAGGLTTARRAELVAQRKFMVTQVRQERGAVALRVAHRPTRPDGDRIDRAVSKVAADGAPRPSPLWAGVAGLLLGVSLFALWLAVPADRRPGPAPPVG
jgi:hypothetical protein